jgi:hypothetical protein
MRDTIEICIDKPRRACLNMEACERIGRELGFGDEFDLGALLDKLTSKSPRVYAAFLWGMLSACDETFTLAEAKRILTVPLMPRVLEAVAKLTTGDGTGSDGDAAEADPPMARD